MNKGSPSIMEGSLLTLSLYMLVFFGEASQLFNSTDKHTDSSRLPIQRRAKPKSLPCRELSEPVSTF